MRPRSTIMGRIFRTFNCFVGEYKVFLTTGPAHPVYVLITQRLFANAVLISLVDVLVATSALQRWGREALPLNYEIDKWKTGKSKKMMQIYCEIMEMLRKCPSNVRQKCYVLFLCRIVWAIDFRIGFRPKNPAGKCLFVLEIENCAPRKSPKLS